MRETNWQTRSCEHVAVSLPVPGLWGSQQFVELEGCKRMLHTSTALAHVNEVYCSFRCQPILQCGSTTVYRALYLQLVVSRQGSIGLKLFNSSFALCIPLSSSALL